jgi:hypothetical protein
MKRIALVALCLTAATTIALADAKKPTARSYFKVDLSIVTPTGTRSHTLSVGEGNCSSVAEKTSTYEDAVDICIETAAKGVAVSVGGVTATLPSATTPRSEYRAKGEAVLAATGGSVQVGRANGPRFSATVAPL